MRVAAHLRSQGFDADEDDMLRLAKMDDEQLHADAGRWVVSASRWAKQPRRHGCVDGWAGEAGWAGCPWGEGST